MLTLCWHYIGSTTQTELQTYLNWRHSTDEIANTFDSISIEEPLFSARFGPKNVPPYGTVKAWYRTEKASYRTVNAYTAAL